MTEKLFLKDSYLKISDAQIVALTEQGIIVNQTPFYARSGGQPGDKGRLYHHEIGVIEIMDTIYSEDRQHIIHIPAENTSLEGMKAGDEVRLELDWDYRYPIMRMHSCMHLLSVALPFPVTGGQMSASEGRLDFDLPEFSESKEDVTARLNALIKGGHTISDQWISDEELDANPDLIKTMSVKPPRGSGFVRLVRIGDVDLQPCGGTHVKNSGEIGNVIVHKVEKKGKQNRRVRVQFA